VPHSRGGVKRKIELTFQYMGGEMELRDQESALNGILVWFDVLR
jgi:hypothetical protein